ncbi:M67 family metallopeptidase [Novosphingobium organovorum]|uniref:M67 family metallopeptidase n=1 Tax=Novosphingobium organovorum TaxID=2930092 RepID=UPI002E0E1037
MTRGVCETLHSEAARAAPNECCGLLLGAPGQGEGQGEGRSDRAGPERIVALLPARNVDSDPARRFEIDPLVLLRAHRAAREGGPRVLGYYHSHPTGNPAPSATDAEHSTGDWRIWAIIGGRDIAFWRDRGNGFDALAFRVV